MKPEIFEFKANFNVDGNPHSIKVIHNLGKGFGLSIEVAFTNWVHRTHKFTSASFCKYVMSKNESFVCVDEDGMKRLNEQ